MLSWDDLYADLVRGAFAPSSGPPQIGAEVELLVIDADTRLPVPIRTDAGASSLPLLRAHAAEEAWIERGTAAGVPCWDVPGRGIISYEAGGQLEFSAAPHGSATALLDTLHTVALPLRRRAADAGIELIGIGIDPVNPVERAPLELSGERYTRMAAHFARAGSAGARMMRQTASFQVNLDWGPPSEAWLRWRVLNAAAPALLAGFANSPTYLGAPTGHQSFRAAQWRRLDPARTGVLPCGPDAAGEYLDWALRAPAFLLGPAGAEALPFAAYLGDPRVGLGDWRVHLSTLFPEVRPKGFLEVRALDAVATDWYAAPIVLLSGLLYDPHALRRAVELLGPPDPAKLVRAGEVALADPVLAQTARELWMLGLAGCRALGADWVSPAILERAQEFADRYVLRGISPADDILATAR